MRRGRRGGSVVGSAALTTTIAALLLALSACGTSRPETRMAEAVRDEPEAEAALVPRAVLFGNPERARARLSPDGSQIAFLAPDEGVLNVWVAPVADPAAARPVTKDRGRGIHLYFWAYTNDHILYLQDADGDENWRLHRVDLGADETTDLTPFDGVQTRILGVSHLHPEAVVVSWNDRDPRFHEVYRVDIASGAHERVQENDRFASFVVDDDYRVRFAVAVTPEGGQAFYRPDGSGGWAEAFSVPMEDALTTDVVAFTKGGERVYLLDSRGRDTAALVAYDPATGAKEVLVETERADIGGALLHPTEKTVQAASYEYERVRWTFLSEEVEADFERLAEVARGDVEIVSRTLDDRQWLVAFLPDDGPVRYYHFDRESDEVRFLFSNRPALERVRLARMHPVVIEARDGLKLVSYLSLPPTLDEGGRPTQPLPMVLLVHGGPWARDSWGYDAIHQWLANRGYAVLSVNYRGSTGFGKGFLNAANEQWAAAMHDDLVDAVDWAIVNRVADRERVCIMGGSYGGYATLVGLAFTPERFACGVDIVGPSNLLTLLASIPPYWKPMFEMFAKRVGDPRTPEGEALLKERSPLFRADAIRRPLLIAQGANDPRVKQAESDQIVAALEEHDVPVTYVLYPDEGHGFRRPENRLAFFAIAEAFLAEVLGGRAQALTAADLEGASLQVPTGAAVVPGLEAALGR